MTKEDTITANPPQTPATDNPAQITSIASEIVVDEKSGGSCQGADQPDSLLTADLTTDDSSPKPCSTTGGAAEPENESSRKSPPQWAKDIAIKIYQHLIARFFFVLSNLGIKLLKYSGHQAKAGYKKLSRAEGTEIEYGLRPALSKGWSMSRKLPGQALTALKKTNASYGQYLDGGRGFFSEQAAAADEPQASPSQTV